MQGLEPLPPRYASIGPMMPNVLNLVGCLSHLQWRHMTPGVQKANHKTELPKCIAIAALNGRLTLVRANVRAILFLSIAFQEHLK